jgi:hypothetical protein
MELLDVQLRAEAGEASPEDAVRLAGEVLRCWDELGDRAPRSLRWVDLVELQAKATFDGQTEALEVLRLAGEVLRCWDRLYPQHVDRMARPPVDDGAWRFAAARARRHRPPLERLARAVTWTTVRVGRGVVTALRRLAADV